MSLLILFVFLVLYWRNKLPGSAGEKKTNGIIELIKWNIQIDKVKYGSRGYFNFLEL